MVQEEAFRAALAGLSQLGWTVTQRSPMEAAYRTAEGRRGTLCLVPRDGAWAWLIDSKTLPRRGRHEAVRPEAPPDRPPRTELVCSSGELLALAAAWPAWLMAYDSGETLPRLPVATAEPFEGGYGATSAAEAVCAS